VKKLRKIRSRVELDVGEIIREKITVQTAAIEDRASND
jgi:hypothetical protein